MSKICAIFIAFLIACGGDTQPNSCEAPRSNGFSGPLSGGGGTAGITNSAGSNFITRSTGAGSGVIASSITDTGTLVSTLSQVQIGPVTNSSDQLVLIVDNSTTDTATFWTQEGATNHVGSLGNNEQIDWVARNNDTFNTAANAGHATILDGIVNCGESAGAKGVTCTVLAPNASCSTSDCTAYSYNSQFGIMEQDGPVTFGGPSGTSVVQLGNTVKRFTVLDASPTTITPQLDIGVIASVDGLNMHIKNTATAVNGAGIAIGGDTTVAANVTDQIAFYRGPGGGFGGLFGLICIDNGSSSCMSGAAANDFVVANYFSGKATWVVANGPVIIGTTGGSTLTLTSGHHMSATGPALSFTNAACSSTNCTDIAGTITSSSTSMTITFASTYTGANDATCIIQGQGTATLPTCTESATAITCTVVANATKYNYQCIGHQ